jgi:hypothetical protein
MNANITHLHYVQRNASKSEPFEHAIHELIHECMTKKVKKPKCLTKCFRFYNITDDNV